MNIKDYGLKEELLERIDKDKIIVIGDKNE